MTIENERDIEDYLKTLLDFSNSSHRQFCDNYKVIRHFKDGNTGGVQHVYRNCDGEYNARRKKKEKSKTPDKDISQLIDQLSISAEEQTSSEEKQKKSGKKFVNLYSAEGVGKDVVILKGRHHCNCQASKHRLVNNCLNCGRIVCSQEGSGPCLFCGTLVCSKEEKEFINANTIQSKKLFDNLMEVGMPEGWEKAIEHRDKLLEYDRTTERRTKVIDDEGEYYSVGSVWLSPAEKEKLQKKEEDERKRRHASRLDKKFTFDFAGRQVQEDSSSDLSYELEEDSIYTSPPSSSAVMNPDISPQWQLEFIPCNPKSSSNHKGNNKTCGTGRVQDRRLLEMSDAGVCLSMHQPWASLLVHGIKRHEGRCWYSSHRGRLWIASAAKPPSESDISACEAMYRLLRGNDVEFPKNYPTGCLLGCVTVTDVLSQEEYQSRYDDGESDSPFVFICEDPLSLSLKFPMSGQHKIYKLDNKIHVAAQKALNRM